MIKKVLFLFALSFASTLTVFANTSIETTEKEVIIEQIQEEETLASCRSGCGCDCNCPKDKKAKEAVILANDELQKTTDALPSSVVTEQTEEVVACILDPKEEKEEEDVVACILDTKEVKEIQEEVSPA